MLTSIDSGSGAAPVGTAANGAMSTGARTGASGTAAAGTSSGSGSSSSPAKIASQSLPHAMPTGVLGPVRPPPNTIAPPVVMATVSPTFNAMPVGVYTSWFFKRIVFGFGAAAPVAPVAPLAPLAPVGA